LGRAQGGEGSRTGQGVQDLHDGAGLGDARKVVDDQRHEEGAAPGEHDGDAAEDSSPGDGRDGVVEDQVALLGAEAAVGFGHLCCLEGVFGGLAGDPNGWIGVVFFEILEEGAGRGGSWKFVDSGLAFCWSPCRRPRQSSLTPWQGIPACEARLSGPTARCQAWPSTHVMLPLQSESTPTLDLTSTASNKQLQQQYN